MLYTSCNSCQEDIRVRSWASTRPELAKEKDDEFMINCDKCGISIKTHVNDVRAKGSRVILIGGIIISIIVTAVPFHLFRCNSDAYTHYSSTDSRATTQFSKSFQFI